MHGAVDRGMRMLGLVGGAPRQGDPDETLWLRDVMTLDVYADLFADDLDTVAARLDVLGRAAAEANADQLRTESPSSDREVLKLSSTSTA